MTQNGHFSLQIYASNRSKISLACGNCHNQSAGVRDYGRLEKGATTLRIDKVIE